MDYFRTEITCCTVGCNLTEFQKQFDVLERKLSSPKTYKDVSSGEVSCREKTSLFSCIVPSGSHGNYVQKLCSYAWTSVAFVSVQFNMSYYYHREQHCQLCGELGSFNGTNQTLYHQSEVQWISVALRMNLLLAVCGCKENQRAPLGLQPLQSGFGLLRLCCFQLIHYTSSLLTGHNFSLHAILLHHKSVVERGKKGYGLSKFQYFCPNFFFFCGHSAGII